MSRSQLPEAISNVAVFDFDGTLTKGDTLLPFLRMVVGKGQFWWGMMLLSPILIGYRLKLIPNWRAKKMVLTYFLAGKTEKQLQPIAHRFATQIIPKMLRPEALKRLHWHQQQSHQTLLISASLEIYLLPWAQIAGFKTISGTQLEMREGKVTGDFLGKNCYGIEKAKRLKTILGEDLKPYRLYAYGDSHGDRELLAVATYAYYRKFGD